MNKLMTKWEFTGLLKKCKSESEKMMLCNCLESMTNYMFSIGYNECFRFTLPLVARIFYYKPVTSINNEIIMDCIRDVCKKHVPKDINISVEFAVELTEKMARKYIKKVYQIKKK